LLAVALTLGIPAGALANHRFTDVATGAFYHAAVSAIADAGITLGCGGTNFCPDDPVTRGQMAAFMHRSLSRVAFGSTGYISPNITVTPQVITSVTIKAGESAGGDVYVKVDGAYSAYLSSMTGCPCLVRFWLSKGTSSTEVSTNNFASLTTIIGSFAIDSGAVTMTAIVPSGSIATFNLNAQLYAGTGNGTVSGWGDVTAIYAPFGSQGTSAP